MKFSTGGHLFLAIDNKGYLQVFNSYTLVRIQDQFRVQLGVTDVVFGEKDQPPALVAADGLIDRWRHPTFQLIKEGCPERNIDSLDFISDPKERSLRQSLWLEINQQTAIIFF